MINHCHGKHQTSVPENAYKQQFRMLILGELLQVTSISTLKCHKDNGAKGESALGQQILKSRFRRCQHKCSSKTHEHE